MGLFSSIKKGLSKAWKGVKKAVKKVAKGVKKVAKGIVTSLPGGQKLWKEGGRLGKKIMKGIGKITSALGPIGTMALSFVLAPVMGPMISSLWSGFGAGAAAMATSANAFVSTLGSMGSGIFAAGNWIGGTLGAMGNALTEGAKNVMTGNFSGAVNAFATNMSNALTGKAGMTAVNAAAAQAANQAGTLLGQSLDATTAVQAGVDPSFATENLGMQAPAEIPMGLGEAPITSVESIASQGASQFTPVSMENIAQEAVTGKIGAMNLAETGAFVDYGADGVRAIQPQATTLASPSESSERLSQVKSLLGGGGSSQESGFQPYVPRMTKAQAITSATNASGQGSSGFSLLGGVQGLEESLRNSQRLMFG